VGYDNIKIFENPIELSKKLVDEFINFCEGKERINIALAGGSTPKIFYTTLSQSKYCPEIMWKNIHIYWGDERCVPPNHSESNFLMVKQALIDHIQLPPENIHRIFGENSPSEECQRYSRELSANLPGMKGKPQFDWIFLGLGDDGHTASLFPCKPELSNNNDLCVVATHPQTGQKRISLGLPVLKNAARISFLVTNTGKGNIIERILGRKIVSPSYPASLLYNERPDAEWWLDKDAAEKILVK
jgi:6-phosphogluconolactonase